VIVIPASAAGKAARAAFTKRAVVTVCTWRGEEYVAVEKHTAVIAKM
jgi:hypothetical protein